MNGLNTFSMNFAAVGSMNEAIFGDGEDEAIYNILQYGQHCLSGEKDPVKKHGGSLPGRRKNIDRNFAAGHDRIYQDYFSENPTYGNADFERRFRMPREMFYRVMDHVALYDDYFIQRPDCTGRMGLSTLQKCTAAIRMLAYGYCADSLDEYCRIAESTALETLKRFCRALVDSTLGKIYLRRPDEKDIKRVSKFNTDRGLPGLFGCLDCMHVKWKNCPKAYQGQYIEESMKTQRLSWKAWQRMTSGYGILILERQDHAMISIFLIDLPSCRIWLV